MVTETDILAKIKSPILVDTRNLSRQEWLDYRRRGIGGSDCPVIMGESPFMTLRELYYDKLNMLPTQENEDNQIAKQVGTLLEDYVAELFSKKSGLPVIKVPKMFQHPTYPYLLADIDFFTLLPDGSVAIVECKTTHPDNSYLWAKEQVPIRVELQGYHYMMVLNVNTVFFACLLGNNQFLHRKRERNLDLEAKILLKSQDFWFNHVVAKIPPPFTEDSELALQTIRHYWGNKLPQGIPLPISQQQATDIEHYFSLQQKKKQLESEARQIEKKMQDILVPFLEQMDDCGSFALPYKGQTVKNLSLLTPKRSV